MKILRSSQVSLLAVAIAVSAGHAHAITMTATYYTIGETDQDMNHLATGVFNNEVQNMLGIDGLPILNTTTYGCTTNCFTATPLPQDLTATGEITWWSPTLNNGGTGGTSDVVQTGSAAITTPFSNGSFYPPSGSGSNDASGFQAAVLSSTLNVPTAEAISFNVGADDDAFVYLDGSLVCDLGGVHSDSPGTCTSGTLTAGTHNLELFYADIEEVGAALTFDVTTAGVTGTGTGTGTSVPEPATLALLATALGGLGLARRRRG